MSDGPLWLDAFPHNWDAAHERTVHGRSGTVVYGLALLLDQDVLAAYDGAGLAWKSDQHGPAAEWLGVLDDEVHLRAGGLRHRIDLPHGRTSTEPMPR